MSRENKFLLLPNSDFREKHLDGERLQCLTKLWCRAPTFGIGLWSTLAGATHSDLSLSLSPRNHRVIDPSILPAPTAESYYQSCFTLTGALPPVLNGRSGATSRYIPLRLLRLQVSGVVGFGSCLDLVDSTPAPGRIGARRLQIRSRRSSRRGRFISRHLLAHGSVPSCRIATTKQRCPTGGGADYLILLGH